MAEFDCDVLILGGGSAGSVMASRLSEASGLRLILVEAGPDFTPETLPDDVNSPYPGRAYFDPALRWNGLTARLSGAAPGPYEQGRGLGGCSLINGIGSNRGAPSDYDEWAAAGAEGWSWDEVLPWFRAAEDDAEFGDSDPLHAKGGPWPVRRIPAADQTGFTRAVTQAAASRFGLQSGRDQNGDWRDGVYPTAVNLDAQGRRVSMVSSYLRAEVRARPNLKILCDHHVLRLSLEGQKVTGAELRGPQGRFRLKAAQVVLSAGALQTPAVLMRSGIGPAATLQRAGVVVRHDLPGVGQNLMEHPSIGVTALLRPGARMEEGDHYHIQTILRWSSELAGAPRGDMHTAVVARAGWHAVGRQMGSLFSWVNKSYSTGEVRLHSADPNQPPDIDFRLLSDERDLQRLKEAFRFAATLLAGPELAKELRAALPSSFSPRIKRWLAPTGRNRVLTALAAPMIDRLAPARAYVLRVARGDSPPLTDLLADDAALTRFVRANAGGVWHPCGTARMGAADDPRAVTLPDGRVRGLSGLRIVDASLMPTIPCANLNLPVIMMAEKLAASLRRDLSEGVPG